MLSTKSLSSLFVILLLLTSCHRAIDDSPVVARVYNYELHQSDLDGLVADGISADDSTAIVANYVEQWIRQMVLLSKAEKNIKDNFDKQMREYKNSLLIYAYEQQMVNQLLDTVVTDSQISAYYDEHRSDFVLRGAIVRAVYVVAPSKMPAVARLKSIISRRQFDEKDVVELEETASRSGLNGYYDVDSWMPFYNLQRAVPITTYNENLYLKHNHTIVLDDDNLTYLVRIVDYKVSDELSPLEMQTDNIRSIILNHRKLDILSRLQSDLLQQAEKSDNVKRYI